MDKIRSLLLTLAMVFAALAVFEFGARYGGTNVRAQAVAEQLYTFTQLRVSLHSEEHGSKHMPVISAAQLDLLIARAVLLRQVWYLGIRNEADDVLDNAITQALKARGAENVIQSFEDAIANAENPDQLNTEKIDEIIVALKEAKVDLIDNAPEATGTKAGDEAKAPEKVPATE